jgi:restriction system protein
VLAAAAKPPQAVDFVHPLVHGLVHSAMLMWPLWLILAGVGALKLAAQIYNVRRLRRAGIFDIDRMDGETFERRLEALFKSLGYRAEVVGSARGDFGGDLIVAKDGKRSVVQAKCWSKNIGVKAVQEVVAARGYYRVDSALVVTNRHFTKQAQELAKRNDVKLWGRDELVACLLKTQKASARGASATAGVVAPNYLPESLVVDAPLAAVPAQPAVPSAAGAFCARCGESVSVKVRDYCIANTERFAGLVYCFKHQRDVRH